VIDPGGDPGEILAFLAKERLTCRLIVNTHGHFDHISGNRALKSATGASLLVHGEDLPMLTEAVAHARLFMMPRRKLAAGRHAPRGSGRGEGRRGAVAGASHAGALAGGDHTRAPGVAFCVTWSSTVQSDVRTCGGSERALLESIRPPYPDHAGRHGALPGHGPETTVGLEKRQNPFFRLAGR